MSPGPILIGFGANIDPLRHILAGVRRLMADPGVIAVSTVYRSHPVGVRDQPDFLNGAIQLRDGPAPEALKARLRAVEALQQRRRDGARFGPRTLDLDIALMGGLVFSSGGLVIPDPDILARPFLALPLAELAPDLIHPTVNKSLRDIAAGFGAEPAGMWVDGEATRALGFVTE